MSRIDFAPDAHRLAMELECLLLECADTRAVSKWWDSANDALDQHRALCAAIESVIDAHKPVGYGLFVEGKCLSIGQYPSSGHVGGKSYKSHPLYTTPQPCQKITRDQVESCFDAANEIVELRAKCAELDDLSAGNKEGMVLVTKEDAENYCRILSLLGMEEEGSPVEDIERLISLRDGMTCGDCNDTGWLENREEGRYPCTCMTEAEPYQILEAERDALAMQNWQMREALAYCVNQIVEFKDVPGVSAALTIQDMSTSVLNRIKAQGIREAYERVNPKGQGSPLIHRWLEQMADELEGK